MKEIGQLAVIAIALWLGSASIAKAQPPIRIGATLSQTGAYATVGQGILRGYQLCMKRTNEKDGVLGRKVELVVYDDRSDPTTAARLYEQLITRDKVDLVLGPFSSLIADPVAGVTEKHKMPMVAPVAAATFPFRKGRKFLFSMLPPAEVQLEGLLDLAAKKGLKTVALINVENDIGTQSVIQGAIELARKKGLGVVLADAYPLGTADFSAILTRVRAANPDVLGVAAPRPEDAVAITRQLKALDVNPRMVGFSPSEDVRRLYEALGRDAEFVYSASFWVPELVEVRAGGLIPIARQYPGAREFVEAHKKEFPGAIPSARQYDFHKVRLTAGALRGLAWRGQSRSVLEAHHERGGQP